jgi:hypothetical protein
MPQYRKLFVKVVDSPSFNEMPDDFTRLTWVLLPLICCREGRAIDHPNWLSSKLYPYRTDVTHNMINDAFNWFEDNDLIRRYEVEGRKYLYITNWYRYQGNTTKETESIYPGPELGKTESRVTPELVESKSRVGLPLMNTASASISESEVESESVEPFRELFDAFLDATGISEMMIVGHKAVTEINDKWIPSGVTVDEVKAAAKTLQDKNFNISGPWSLTNTINMLRSGKKSSANKPLSEKYKLPEGYDNDDDDYQDDDDDEPQPDTKWETFVQEYVKDRRWKNLLEYSGYDDDGKVIIHVPEEAMAEAMSRFSSSLDRYYLGQFTLEGVAT